MNDLLTMVLVALAFFAFGFFFAIQKLRQKYEKEFKKHVEKSKPITRGLVGEQLAPFLPDFPGNYSEAKFIGKPVDFLIFKGLDDKKITEVIFVEVKSGAASLTPTEKSLKQAIEEKRVSWKEHRILENNG